jgi:hypothetical protein
MTKQALIELRDRVAAGSAPDILFYTWRDGLSGTRVESKRMIKAYNGSLDAAVAFLEAVLPDWIVLAIQQFEIGNLWLATICHPQGEDWPKWTPYPETSARSDTPARALLLATLSALIEGAE